MNEKVRGMIVAGVVLAALGGTLGVLHLTGMDKTSGDESSDASSVKSATASEDLSVKLIDVDPAEIRQIDVTNEFGGFTYTGESASGKESYGIAELKGIDLDVNKMEDIGEDTANLTAYKPVEDNAEDLAKYGLSEPAAEFDITFADGSHRIFLIGDKAHQNRYRYVTEKDTAAVYMVQESIIQNFLGRKEDLVDTSLFPSNDSDGSDEFGVLKVHREDLDYDMVFEQDKGDNERSNENMPSAQVMTEPIFSYLNGSTSSDIIFAMYGLTAMSAETVHPTDEDLKTFGLDKPRAVITYSGDSYDWTLNIGGEYHDENAEGSEQTAASAYYCTIAGVDGKDAVWKLEASALPWVDLLPGDIITSLMTYNNIWEVASVKLTGKVDTEYTIDHDGEDITATYVDGAELDVETFKSLYQYILTCPTSEIWFEEPKNEPYLTIEINRTDGGGDKIEICKDTDRRDIVKLNGRTSYKIKTSWVTRLLENVESVKNGGTVQENY